jgi:hypothetical protein
LAKLIRVKFGRGRHFRADHHYRLPILFERSYY